uniref:Putative secreted protein n=1 Tax=Ixodes ricinus TaxID=34613 RepID=A0A6B0UYY5_IXORI
MGWLFNRPTGCVVLGWLVGSSWSAGRQLVGGSRRFLFRSLYRSRAGSSRAGYGLTAVCRAARMAFWGKGRPKQAAFFGRSSVRRRDQSALLPRALSRPPFSFPPPPVVTLPLALFRPSSFPPATLMAPPLPHAEIRQGQSRAAIGPHARDAAPFCAPNPNATVAEPLPETIILLL